MYAAGQCVIGRLPFKDGTPSLYWRPYLIIAVDKTLQEVSILNISSVAGKEHKLGFHANVLLKHSIPPLTKPSFVKTDSCQVICFDTAKDFFLLADGFIMPAADLNTVLERYRKINK